MTIERKVDFLRIPIKTNRVTPLSSEVLRGMNFSRYCSGEFSTTPFEQVDTESSDSLMLSKGHYQPPTERWGVSVPIYEPRRYAGEAINQINIEKPRNRLGIRVVYRWRPNSQAEPQNRF